MKYRISIVFLGVAMIISSCKTTFQMTGKGENFNALTRITEPGIVYAGPRGGDNGANLVFGGLQNNVWNIYSKEKVLSASFTQKTNGVSGCYSPDYCAETNNIAFAYLSDGNMDICSINGKNGKAITKLISSTDQEFNPSWSPDGKFLTYETGVPLCAYTGLVFGGKVVSLDRIMSNQIWVKDLNSNEVKMIGIGNFPKFSPDGKQIAFIKTQTVKGGYGGSICVMTPDGENLKQLTDVSVGYPSSPSWSSNGKNIVFSLSKLKDKSKYINIYSVDVTGENLKQYTQYAHNLTPCLSNDNYLYFTSDRGSKEFKYSIWRFKID